MTYVSNFAAVVAAIASSPFGLFIIVASIVALAVTVVTESR